jgi:hypothetical protein
MHVGRRWKLVVAAGATLAIAGGGVAIGATQFGSPSQESQAVVNDAAKQLGVTPAALSNALKQALENRVDAAVAAGRLTKAQGDALKARIRSGSVPFFGFGPGGPHHFGEDLQVAADYLGLTTDQLRSQLESGKTMAAIAKENGKSVDGLVNALYNAEKKELDQAVSDGKLTKDQEQTILMHVRERITAKVNGTLPQFNGRSFRFRAPGAFGRDFEHFHPFGATT